MSCLTLGLGIEVVFVKEISERLTRDYCDQVKVKRIPVYIQEINTTLNLTVLDKDTIFYFIDIVTCKETGPHTENQSPFEVNITIVLKLNKRG